MTLAVVLFLVVGASLAIALSSHTSEAHGADPAVATPTTLAPPAPATCPLTGTPAPGGQVPRRPALAIKVDNYPTARPQSGLDAADIVYEEPVEGGITRLVAVFQCQGAALVGPIRSARAVDLQILDELSRPLFIHAGGINPVLGMLQSGNLIDDNIFDYQSIVISPADRYAPYDTYTSTAFGWGLDPTDTTPPAPVFRYSADVPNGGSPAAQVHIPFSQTNDVTWSWSPALGRFLLAYSGVAASLSDGATISAANVVVQTVQVHYGPWLENDLGGLEVQSTMTGSGPLIVLRNGEAVRGKWQRASLSAPTRLVSSRGAPISLTPGNTWVEIVPSSIPVTVTP
jgi:hypothetical protein